MPHSPPIPRKSIAIIGAGICGPVFALQLLTHPILRQRYKAILYDRAPDPSSLSDTDRLHSAGAAVGLFPNGLYPLYKLGLREAIERRSAEIETVACYRCWSAAEQAGNGLGNGDSDGEANVGRWKLLGRAKNESWAADVGSSGRAIERGDLRDVLMRAVAEKDGEVRWGRKLIRLEEVDGGKVRVVFEEGEAEDVDLVVGADGAFSAVRKFVLMGKYGDEEIVRHKWLPQFVGAAGLYGIASLGKLKAGQASQEAAKDTMGIWLDMGNLSTSPLPSGKIRWDLQIVDDTEPRFPPVDAEDEPNMDLSDSWSSKIVPGVYRRSKTIAALRQHKSYYHPVAGSFQNLLEASDRIIHSPLRQAIWEKDEIQNGRNAVCIGDASRVLLPSAGQGTNMSIEDATILADRLLKFSFSSELHTDLGPALKDFAEERLSRNRRYFGVAQWARKFAMGETWFWRQVRDLIPLTMAFSKDGRLTQKGRGQYPFDFRAEISSENI